MDIRQLIDKARGFSHCRVLTDECTVGEVGAALLAESGNVYTGVSISAASGIGFCAEHSAVAQMLTNGESQIKKVVAVSANGRILPPCGRCRELIYQINKHNLDTQVILGPERVLRLEELLPERWQEV